MVFLKGSRAGTNGEPCLGAGVQELPKDTTCQPQNWPDVECEGSIPSSNPCLVVTMVDNFRSMVLLQLNLLDGIVVTCEDKIRSRHLGLLEEKVGDRGEKLKNLYYDISLTGNLLRSNAARKEMIYNEIHMQCIISV